MKIFTRGFWVVLVLGVAGIFLTGNGCSDPEATLKLLEELAKQSSQEHQTREKSKQNKNHNSSRNKHRHTPTPTTLTGVVTRVADGDTLNLRVQNGETYRIRCQAVDAPELNQEFGQQARATYNELVYRKTVRVEVDKTDKFGRIVGRIWCKDPASGTWFDVEEVMLKRGMVWHYTRYNHEQKLINAEAEARRNCVGLWSQKNPKKPEDWRIQNRENAQ
ncbi:MAG: thermonuclease family protein [Planctomycetia bacterium]|nr:thermonuclease family protein [Planctomycetia bacterium]